MINIVCDGLKYICMDKLYEYDFGQSLQITGLTLTGPTVEAHFCIKGNDDSVLVMGTLDGDVAVVPVPNSMLEDAGLINAYIYERNNTAGKTVYKFELRVERRADLPTATYDPTEEEISYFTHVIEVITEQAEIVQAIKDELLAGLTIGDVETLPAGSAATADLVEAGGIIKLDLGIPQGEKGERGDTEGLTVDSELSAESENPVQNKVISGALTGKADKTYVDTTVQNAKLKNVKDGAGTGAVEEGCLSGNTVVSATGQYAHAEGMSTKAQGARSHAEGGGTTASGGESHAEGAGTKATADSAHAEGGGSTASGNYAHAEGSGTTASGQASHAEGAGNTAVGANAHAEGAGTRASGDVSHAEGISTKATAQGSHAEGSITEANGMFSHAGGLVTKADGFAQTVIGEYNLASGTSDLHTGADDELFIIGNGEASARSNAHTTSKGGVGWYQTDVKVGGTGHTDATLSLVDMNTALAGKADKTYVDTEVGKVKADLTSNAYQHIQMINNNDIWKINQTLANVRSGSKAYAENKTAITINSAASLNSYFQAFLLNPVPAYVSSPYVDDTLVIDMEYSTDFTNLYLVLYGESASDRERIVLESGTNKHIRLSAKLNVPTYIYLWTNDSTQVSKSITIKNALMYYGNPAINPQMFIKHEDGNGSGVIHRALIIAPNSSVRILRPVEDLNRHGFATELTTYGSFYRHYIEWFDSFDVLVINNSSYSGAIPVWETTSPAQAVLAIKYWMEHGKKVIYYATDRTNRITKLQANGTLIVGSLDTLFPITITRELNVPASATIEYSDDCPSGLNDCINTEFPTAQNVVYDITGTGLVNVVDVVDGNNTYHACVIKPNEYAVVGLGGSGNADTVGACRYVDIGALATELVGGSGAALAQDMANGKRIIAFGVDGDITTDKTAVDVFTQSFFTTPIEVGLRTALLNDSLGEAYRETPGNARFCTHGKYHSTNALTNREETHTIPSSLYVFLDYYCFAAASYTLTSVTSEDETVTYTPVNLGTTVTEGHYLLDKASGIISFASADQGKTIKIKYSPLDDGKDWIPSVPELNQYNLQSTDCIYLTSHQHAISGQTYQQAEQRGYIMSDHIDQVERCNHFMGRGLLDKVVPLTNPTWVNPNTLLGYDGEVYGTTKTNALETVLPNAVARVEKWNQPLMWYSHDYTTNNGDERCLYGGTRFNADWSKATYAETIANLREFFASLRTYIGEHNGSWITRSSHAIRYTLLQKYVKWNDFDGVIIVNNTGSKPITGVTFRRVQNGEPTKIVDQNGNDVQYTYNSGKLLLWFDLAPSERKEITIC